MLWSVTSWVRVTWASRGTEQLNWESSIDGRFPQARSTWIHLPQRVKHHSFSEQQWRNALLICGPPVVYNAKSPKNHCWGFFFCFFFPNKEDAGQRGKKRHAHWDNDSMHMLILNLNHILSMVFKLNSFMLKVNEMSSTPFIIHVCASVWYFVTWLKNCVCQTDIKLQQISSFVCVFFSFIDWKIKLSKMKSLSTVMT